MAMPYGCLNSQKLSQASRLGVEKALDWWQKSMQTSKHKTYFVIAGYDEDEGQEIRLRREIVNRALEGSELLNNVVEVSARNEAGLAQKIARIKELLPVETITVFAESRNAVSVKAIFKRKFRKALYIRKYKARFEFNHRWVSTSTSFAWLSRNWLLRIWFEVKRRMGRRLRKKIRFLFRT
jgi:exoribonuclease R